MPREKRAPSASTGLSLGRCQPKEASRAASSTGGHKRSEHHLHEVDSRWQVPSPPQRSEHHRHQPGRFFCRCNERSGQAPPKRPASSASSGLLLLHVPYRSEYHLHQVNFRLAGAAQRSEHRRHQQGCFRASGELSLGRCSLKKRASSASSASRLAGARPKKRASPCQTARASSASGGLSLGSCPARRSEHHRHQEGCSWSNCPSIICIGWTLAWQLPRPKKRAPSASGGLPLVKLPEHHLHQVDSRLAVAPPKEASIIGIRRAAACQTAQASSASGGLSLGSCPAQKSEHHRHQEGCSLSNCPSITCIGWTLAWQLPRPRKRASSASGGLLLVKLPEHHLHQVDSRLAVAPPEEASIFGMRRAAPCQTARASSASGGLSLGSCPAQKSEHRRHQQGCFRTSGELSLGRCSLKKRGASRLASAPPQKRTSSAWAG